MKQVRIGVIGCGGMGQGHIALINELPGARLAAVASQTPENARSVGTANRVPYFTDYRRLIESQLCDAVLIATPHYFHPEIGLAAFQAGLHVLCEKPIAVTVRGADALVDAAEKSGRVFGVIHQYRTLPAIRLARELVESGRIGPVRRTLLVDPWYRSQAYYESSNWRATWAGEGGGVLINQAPHSIDFFLWLGGRPGRVTARTRNRLHDIEVEDEADALLEYPNGAWGYYYASTCDLETGPMFEISGDRGRLIYRDGRLELVTVPVDLSVHSRRAADMWDLPRLERSEPPLPGTASGHREIIRNFCAAILEGEPLIAPGSEGLWSVEFINALILSGRQGRPVDLPLDRDEYDRLLEDLRRNSRPKQVVRIQRKVDPKFKINQGKAK